MTRILRLSTLAGAIVAAVLLSQVAPQAANAGPLYRALNGGYYYGPGYAPGYGGYAGYAYTPYGYGSTSGYAYPSYRSYGIGNGYGIGGTYNGIIDHGYRGIGPTYNGIIDYGYGGSRYYGQPYRATYSPYGYGVYGPYGY